MRTPEAEKLVYFVRHGQSEANISPVFQSPDSRLTEKGKEQAAYIAERLSHLSFETLISSPWQRAKETSEIISEKVGKPAEWSELFRERVKPERLNGKSYKDPEADELWQRWEESLYTPGLRVEDGENFDDLLARADNALEFLLKRPEKVMVVVTHGYILRTIFARVLLGRELTGPAFRHFHGRATMENTGLSALKFGKTSENLEENSWHLWIYNDHAHLG